MKAIVLLLALFAMSFAQLNYQMVSDTSIISGFYSDTTAYSRTYALSQYENLRVDVYADDTTNTGFNGDSIKFWWWIETGHLTVNSSDVYDTAWSTIWPLSVDTFDILTSANMTVTPSRVLADGTYDYPLKYIDTTNVSGFAYQSRVVVPEWDVYFRIGFEGLTGNLTGEYIKLQANVFRRVYLRTK